QIGLIYLTEGNYPVALERFKEAIQIANEIEESESKGTFLNNLSLVHLNKGNYTEAWKSSNQALEIFEQLENYEGIAESHYKLGLTYLEQKSYVEAINKHEEALEALSKFSKNYSKLPLTKVLKHNIKLIKANQR
ncbi:MAG: tetratricopeptide repeat protein, partial [Candidatus Lokiarchaeota archaeon]|nr:tetratricopeptide repeat protein [Candidatus Lokiarchaeota archaeon]